MAIKLVKPEDRAANPVAQLAAQADQADQEQAVQTASQNRLAALLPPEVRAAKKKAAQAKLAQDTGEDPRVTKFLAAQTATSGNSLLATDPIRRAAQREKAVQQFFAKNPDLDPRAQAVAATATVKVKDKAVPAEKALQDILRIIATPEEATNAEGKKTGTFRSASAVKQDAIKQYNRIKNQLPPEIRAKYDLDRAEAAGLFESGPSSGARTLASVVSTPGIKQTLQGLGVPSKAVASGFNELWKGWNNFSESVMQLGQNTAEGDPGKKIEVKTGKDGAPSVAGAVKSFQNPDFGWGSIYEEQIKREIETKGSSPYGHLDKDGNLVYSGLAARAGGVAFGALGEVAGDPLSYVSVGADQLAKSGLQTLEKEGLGDVANLIRKGGMKSLDETQLAAVREVLLKTKDPLAAKVQRIGAEGLTDIQMRDLAQSGQRGLKFGGKTVVPFSTGKGIDEAKSAASQLVTSIPTHEIQVGDKFTRDLAGAVVKDYNHDTRLLTVDPGEATAVVRKGEPIVAQPGTFRVGDVLMDGNAKVTAILDDGSVTLKLDNQLESIERPFGIIPRRESDVGGQGTLFGTKEVPAPPPVYQQGTLLSAANEVPILEGVPKIAQEAFDTEAADNLLRVADTVAPQATDDVVRAGDQFIYRDPDGKAAGILSIADDKVETLYIEPSLRGQGISNRLYQAADDAGIDVSKLGADEVTPAGQQARASYLQSKGELPGRVDTATTYRVTRDGGVTPTRVFRQRDGAYVLKDGENIVEPVQPTRNLANGAGAGAKADVHAANSGIEVGQVVGRTPDGKLLLKPAMGPIQQTKIGDHVPGLYGILEEIRPDGVWVIRPDPTLFKKTANAGEVAAAVSPVEAAAPAPATTPAPAAPAGQGALFPEASAPVSGEQGALFDVGSVPLSDLPNVPPFPPRPTVLEDVARVKVGAKAAAAAIETPEAQQKLFDLGITPVRDLKPGDRIRGLGAEVVENQGRRTITAKLDDAPTIVIRGDEVMRLDAADLQAGDILSDSGMKVISRNADGTLTLKGLPPLGAKRVIESVDLGGIPAEPLLRDKAPGIRGLRDAFSPRASVEAAAREGRVSASAGRDLYAAQSGERAALGNALNDMQLRLHSVETRLRQALGRQEASRVLSDAFDVAAGEAGKAQGIADALRADAKAAASPNRAKALNKAADAVETMDQLRKEIASIGEKTDQGALDLGLKAAPDQMPLVLSAQGKKLLALQPNIKDALGIERQLEHLSQGFDFSERAGRTVLRIEDPGVAAGLGEKGSFVEVNLARPAKEINDQIAAAINESTRRALKLDEGDTFKLFEENPLTAYSYRNRTAQTVAIEQDMMANAEKSGLVYRGLTPKAGDGASQAAYEAWKKTVPEHYVPVQGWSTPGEVTFADPAVAKEMSKVRALLRNDEELKAFKRIVDQSSALWTRQVLSPITKGFGQQMRNLQSNLINATFGGLTLDGQKEAIRLQAGALRDAGKLMKTEGLSFDAAIAKLGLDAGGRDATLLRYLRDDDILNTGLYRVLDWGDTTGEKLGGTLKDVAKKRLSPLSGRNVLFAPGRAVNTAIEDNGRMALYISVFDKTGSREAAREAVAKYLFDYADLTTFESHVMKNVNAFYTYMRKNTALQLKVFADRPALPLTVLKAKSALADGDNQDLLAPGEQKDRGLFQAGGALQAVIGGKGVVGLDDPVTSAIRTIDPFIQGAYYTLDKASGGKLSQSLPPTERPTGASVTKGFIGLTAGAPAEALTTIAEVALGKDLRTDRELKETDTWKKLVSAVAPVWDQAQSVQGMATGDKPLRTNLLRMLAGITAYNRDSDQAQYSLNYALLNELDETIKLLQAQGVEVPTLSDLQDAGLVPSASDLKGPRKVTLTPEMKKAEARRKLGLAP